MTHIAKNHPVRFLIESAANGRKLTAGDLEILKRADASLPPGESLSSYAVQVNSAAQRVAAAGGSMGRQAGMEQAEKEWDAIASTLSPDQSALKGSESSTTNQEISDMVSNLFTK